MTAREEGHGSAPESLQGLRFDDLSGAERRRVLGEAFDFRGDVTLRLDDGSEVTGYLFALEAGGPQPHVKLFAADSAGDRLAVPLERITGCAFSGRDTADGRSWEAWVRRWEEKRRLAAQGIDAGDIEPKPEDLG